jgi:hypothetical protein
VFASPFVGSGDKIFFAVKELFSPNNILTFYYKKTTNIVYYLVLLDFLRRSDAV